MAVRVGINGFGRIGRNIMRAALGNTAVDFVAVNDLTNSATLAHLLKYDSVLGNLEADVKATADGISVGGEEFKVLSMKDPAQLPWKDLGVDVVATVGQGIDPTDLGPQPSHVRVERFLPQGDVLPGVDLVVSHGGSGSLMAALSHGLPSLPRCSISRGVLVVRRPDGSVVLAAAPSRTRR